MSRTVKITAATINRIIHYLQRSSPKGQAEVDELHRIIIELERLAAKS